MRWTLALLLPALGAGCGAAPEVALLADASAADGATWRLSIPPVEIAAGAAPAVALELDARVRVDGALGHAADVIAMGADTFLVLDRGRRTLRPFVRRSGE